MHFKKLAIALLALAPHSLFAQDATVTFYASKPADNKPGKAYGGFLYEDGSSSTSQVATLGKGRFVTLRLPAGEHHFSAVFSKLHQEGRGVLDLNVEPGKSYFVRVSVDIKAAFVIYAMDEHLAVVDCQTARSEGDTDKLLEAKNVSEEYRNRLVSGSYFPSCGSSTPGQ